MEKVPRQTKYKAVSTIQQGATIAQVAKEFKISQRLIKYCMQDIRKFGDVKQPKCKPGPKSKITPQPSRVHEHRVFALEF